MSEDDKTYEGYRGEISDEKVAEAISVLMRYCALKNTLILTETVDAVSDEDPDAEPLTLEVIFAMSKKSDEEEESTDE